MHKDADISTVYVVMHKDVDISTVYGVTHKDMLTSAQYMEWCIQTNWYQHSIRTCWYQHSIKSDARRHVDISTAYRAMHKGILISAQQSNAQRHVDISTVYGVIHKDMLTSAQYMEWCTDMLTSAQYMEWCTDMLTSAQYMEWCTQTCWHQHSIWSDAQKHVDISTVYEAIHRDMLTSAQYMKRCTKTWRTGGTVLTVSRVKKMQYRGQSTTSVQWAVYETEFHTHTISWMTLQFLSLSITTGTTELKTTWNPTKRKKERKERWHGLDFQQWRLFHISPFLITEPEWRKLFHQTPLL